MNMGKIDLEDERGKQRLREISKDNKVECSNCKNQTFILSECSDFPFFNCICSKCGSIFVRWRK
jgi:ribosomal protein S27E